MLLFAPQKENFRFKTLLQQPVAGALVRQEVGEHCADLLLDIFRSGGDLSSQTFIQKRVRLCDLIGQLDHQPLKFYHSARWGDSGLVELLELNNYWRKNCQAFLTRMSASYALKRFSGIFKYLRVERKLGADLRHNWPGLWHRNFYVGKSLKSVTDISKEHYPLFEFDIDAKVWALPYDENIWQHALEEVAKKYPELKKVSKMQLCYVAGDKYGTVHYHPLQFVIAEESGISVMDYGQRGLWFQVIRPEALKGVRLIKSGIAQAVDSSIQ
jgi:hypothetical protein